MGKHPTADELDRFRRGAMKGTEALTLGRHLSSCAQCREATRSGRDANADVAGLADAFVPAALVIDRRFEWRRYLVAASVIVVVGSVLIWSLRRPPAPVRPSVPTIAARPSADYGRADWNALVRDALAAGRVQWPDAEIASVRGRNEEMRGPVASAPLLRPAGVIIETTDPRFSWPAVAGAQYQVAIYAGDRTLAESPRLEQNEWTSPDLQRGVTYTWDVRVYPPNGGESIVPAPPAPAARFRIVTDAQESDLESARARFPNDHLLLGLLYARAGIRDRSVEELRQSSSAQRLVPAPR